MRSRQKESILKYLYIKLDEEYTEFKFEMLNHNADYIYSNAYRIDVIINIYEFLMEKLSAFTIEELNVMVQYISILEEFYNHWMKIEDSYPEELSDAIGKKVEIDKIVRENIEKEGRKVANG